MVNHRVEGYIYWTKSKPTLERIVSNQDPFLTDAAQSDPDSQQFQHVQENIMSYRRTIINVRTYCQSTLTSTSQKLLETADAITEEAASTIKVRYQHFLELEPIITVSLERWADSSLEEDLTALFQVIKVYADSAYFDPEVHKIPQKPNQLCVDLAELSIIADVEKARAYWNNYLSLKTAEGFEDFKKEFQEELTSKMKDVKRRLQKKYSSKPFASSLTPSYRNIINAEPIAAFKALQQELQKVGNNPEKYLSHKAVIEEETKKMQQQKEHVAMLTLSSQDLTTFANIDYTERVYDTEGSIMIDRTLKQYQSTVQELEFLLKKKRAYFQQEIERRCLEIGEKVSKISDTSIMSSLNDYEKEALELHQYATILKDPIEEQRTTALYRRIKEIRDYYIPHQNIPAIKRANREETTPLNEVSSPMQPALNEPKKFSTCEEKEGESPTTKIETIQELITYAFRSLTGTHGTIHDLCSLIAGYEKGKFSPSPLKDRINIIRRGSFSTIDPRTLTADERVIYTTINYALEELV